MQALGSAQRVDRSRPLLIRILPRTMPTSWLPRPLVLPPRPLRSLRCNPFHNSHTDDLVSAHDVIYDLHVFFVHATEDGVAAIEMRLRRVRHKPLRTACVFAGQGHADRSAIVGHHVYFAPDRPTGSAVSVAARIAVLHYEVRHDAMDFEAVEIPRASELDEIVDRQRSVFGQE